MSTNIRATMVPTKRSSGPSGLKPSKNSVATKPKGEVGYFPKAIAIFSFLVLWHLLAISPLVDRGAVPTPVEVLQAMIGLWAESSYWKALGTTLGTWGIGLALCAVIGIPVGLLIGVSLRATRSTRWIIDFLRTIPTIALLPLLLLLFGATLRMELTMILLSALWPILIQSMYAVKQVEPLLKWVTRVFRISTMDRLRFLWVPSVSLLVSTGMRLGAITALLVTISAEYLGGAPGLGQQLSAMEEALKRPEVFAYAVTAGIVGMMLNTVIVQTQRRLLWWHPIVRGERSE